MAIRFNQFDPKKAGITLASSLLVLSSVVASHNVMAQENEGVVEEELVVTGIRGSLKNAQALKREAETFVDAISASDIGALPDKSILEAIQRLPGIQIGRFANTDDPDHFGTEGSGVLIRGLKQTRSEFNGRDSFSASSENGLSFQDVSPELMGSVEVFKNQSADMIEGGISGSVSLNTRKPFDSDDRLINLSVSGTYGDMAEEWSPTVSGLFSDRWETDAGDFGVLVSIADSELQQRSQGMQISRFELRPIDPVLGDGLSDGGLASVDDPATGGFSYVPEGSRYLYDGTYSNNSSLAVGDEGVLVPFGAGARQKTDERTRKGYSVALQWESPDDTLLATFEFIRSDAELSWTEVQARIDGEQVGDNQWRVYGDVTGEEGHVAEQFEFDDNGIFQSGNLATVSSGWRANDNLRVPNNASWAGQQVNEFGNLHRTQTRVRTEARETDDISLNLKWTPNENWEFEADYQHVEAEASNDDYSLIYATFAIADLDLSDVRNPSVTLRNPWGFATDAELQSTIDAAGNENVDFRSSNYFSQPSSYAQHSSLANVMRAKGESDSIRLDGAYIFEEGLIKKISAGVRYSDKEQRVGETRFYWGEILPAYSSPIGWLDTDAVVAAGLGSAYDVVDWSGFEAGDFNIEGDNISLVPSEELTRNYQAWGDLFSPLADRCEDQAFHLLGERESHGPDADGNCVGTPYDFTDGVFRPDEIFTTSEKSQAAYIRIDFENELDNGQSLSGNLGLRYVNFENTSEGFTQFGVLAGNPPPSGIDLNAISAANISQFALFDRDRGDEVIDVDNDGAYDPSFLGELENFIAADVRNFNNGESVVNFADVERDYYLPSFNLKWELNDDMLIRAAISKAINKPDIGDRRNYIAVGVNESNTTTASRFAPFYGPQVQVDADGNPVFDATALADINPYPGIAAGSAEDQWNAFIDNGDGTFGGAAVGDTVNGVVVAGDGIPDRDVAGVRTNYQEQRVIVPGSVDFAGYGASAGNPTLKATEALQWDLSFEWYFSEVGSFTTTFFRKKLENFVMTGVFDRAITNPSNGLTQNVRFNGPINGGDAKVQGWEFAYTQTFDFLPGPFDGLGASINYTHVDSAGAPNDDVNTGDPELGLGDSFSFSGTLPLEGQSEKIVNFVLFYEKGPISTRMAYNWNSEFLLTSRDVITELPIWNEAQGHLDASFKYNFTDNFSLSLDGQNLTDEKVRTRQQVDGAGLRLPRSTFVRDRTYTLKATMSF